MRIGMMADFDKTADAGMMLGIGVGQYRSHDAWVEHISFSPYNRTYIIGFNCTLSVENHRAKGISKGARTI